MKVLYKKAILILSLIIAGIVLAFSETNLEYLMAGIRYGDFEGGSGNIIFSENSGFYEEEFYLDIMPLRRKSIIHWTDLRPPKTL